MESTPFTPDVPVGTHIDHDPKVAEVRSWIRPLGAVALAMAWIALGVVTALALEMGTAGLGAEAQVRILGALAAAFGMVHLWLGFDADNRSAAVSSVAAGAAIILLALNALPGNPLWIGVAYALGALASVFVMDRAQPLLLTVSGGLGTLAVITLAV
ncbi:MAG: hypothetical protein AAGA23_21995 [Pseudomonadota bacterium]